MFRQVWRPLLTFRGVAQSSSLVSFRPKGIIGTVTPSLEPKVLAPDLLITVTAPMTHPYPLHVGMVHVCAAAQPCQLFLQQLQVGVDIAQL
jgi:hypothetical protein